MNWKVLLGIVTLHISLSKCDFDRESDEEQREIYDSSLLPVILNATTPPATIPTTTLDYCHCDLEIYGPEDLRGVLKSPNYPGAHCGSGKCIYKILPREDMIVRLYIHSAAISTGTFLKFWNLFYVDGKEYALFHSMFTDREDYYTRFEGYNTYTSAKNAGFMVSFEPLKNPWNFRGFKISFERSSNATDDYICDPTLVVVGKNDTVVTSKRNFTVTSGCSFFLQPDKEAIENNSGEMYIKYDTVPETFVSVRSFDSSGYFTREDYVDKSGIKLVDASKVEVLVKKSASKTGSYMLPNITAKVLNKTCTCAPKIFNLTYAFSTAIITNPGYPHLFCPQSFCESTIQSPPYDKKDKSGLVPLLMITTNCTLGLHDVLRLSSVDTDRVIFRTTSQETVRPKFLRPIIIDQQDLKLTYHAGVEALPRYFQMNVTRVVVERDCVCKNFNDKYLSEGGELVVSIPAKCRIMHCHWKFAIGSYYPRKYVSIEFEINHTAPGDKVFLISDSVTEEYDNHLLTHKRSLTSVTAPIDFTFSRFNSTAENDATLNITWNVVDSCACAANHFQVTEGKAAVIASPHYPEMYCPNLMCRHIFTAPEGYYLEMQLDELDSERYHDYLKLYDGNSTDSPLLSRLTGKIKPQNITSTRGVMVILFQSDESVGGKGYHANVVAHKKPGTDTPSVTHWGFFVVISLSICLLTGAALWFVVFRHGRRPARFQSLTNPTISYASSEMGSTVSIAFSGVRHVARDNMEEMRNMESFESEDV